MIKGIFFDWVGPLLELGPETKNDHIAILAEKYWQDFKDDKKVIEALTKNKITRRLSESDIASIIVERYQEITSVWELLPKLHNTFKMAVINNGMGFTIPYFKNKFHPEDFFDIFINSSMEGLAKPDRKIYELACDRLGLEPEQCIFIDDSEVCVKGAINAGLRGILFENPNKLMLDLENSGVTLLREINSK